jgi:C1A family cysteine protease
VSSKIIRDWLVPQKYKPSLASVYPYKGVQQKCKTLVARTKYFPISQTNFSIDEHKGNSNTYWKALQNGPIVVRVAADTKYWQYYVKGTINDTRCFENGKLNHAVVIVGHSIDEAYNLAYWLVRNSWGTGWGDEGYAKIAINDQGNGICGEMVMGWNVAMQKF